MIGPAAGGYWSESSYMYAYICCIVGCSIMILPMGVITIIHIIMKIIEKLKR